MHKTKYSQFPWIHAFLKKERKGKKMKKRYLCLPSIHIIRIQYWVLVFDIALALLGYSFSIPYEYHVHHVIEL